MEKLKKLLTKIEIPEFIMITFKDKVNLAIAIFAAIIAIVSLSGLIINWGGYVFFFFIVITALMRAGWWKWRYKHKDE